MSNLKIEPWFKVYRWRSRDGGSSGTGLIQTPLTNGEIIAELRKSSIVFLEDVVDWIDIKPYSAPDSGWKRYDQYGGVYPVEDEGLCMPLFEDDLEMII